MFNFKEELAKFRKSLEVSELSGGVSGDEVRDILDIAKELTNARDKNAPAKIEPAPEVEETTEAEPEEKEEPEILAVEAGTAEEA